MYTKIERCYGVLLTDEPGCIIDTPQMKAFLTDLALYEETLDSFGPDWPAVTDWSEQDMKLFVDEFLGDCDYVYQPYSGDRGGPVAVLGVGIKSWPCWELEGSEGIIAAARKDLTFEAVKKFQNKVPKEVRELLAKHGFSVGECWMTSTS